MAVEAHNHLLHPVGGGQKLAAGWDGGALCSDAPAGRRACYYATPDAAVLGRQSHQLLPPPQYQQPSSPCVVGMAVAPAGPMLTVGQYGQVSASESGITFGGAQEAAAPSRKRRRAEQSSQVLGLAAGGGVAALLQQQLVDVDRIVLQHTSRMWAELAEHRRRHARQVVAATEAEAAQRLRAKDAEIERVGRLNLALEERVRGLFVESQVWRDLAQSNEAAANALRAELQQALDARARRGVVVPANAAGGGGAAEDAASCCCGENDVGAGVASEEVRTAAAAATSREAPRRCVMCGDGAAEVLLLPCRHLCACAPCAAAARACPACGCAKNGSVCVNFS